MKEVAEKYLGTSNRTVGFFIPTTKPERTPVPPVPDIAKLVEGYKGREMKAESSETAEVDPLAIEARIQRPEPIGGVKLALLPKKTRGQSVQLRLTLHYGNAENLKGLTDAAGFLSALMSRETKSLNRQQIQDALDKNFARLGGGGGMGGGRRGGGGGGGGGAVGTISFNVQTRRANFAPVLEILRQVLREPTLPAHDFELMKNANIAALEQGRSDPRSLGLNRMQRLLSHYPSDDVRYVPTIDEHIDRLKKTTLENVQTLYREFLGADHGELVVVGDFEPSEIMPILARMLDGWKAAKPYARIDHPYQPDIKPIRETILTPDKENAVYLAALTMPIKDDNPDYPPLVIGNFILGGGGLSSRIANRLRQKDGLSYGAGSGLGASPLDPRAEAIINAIYNPRNVAKVVKGVDEELERFVRDGATAAELEAAKTGYLQQQQNQRTNDMAILAILAENLFVGRTMRFQAEFDQKIKDLTLDAVNAAVRKHIDPKKYCVVTAGDFNKK